MQRSTPVDGFSLAYERYGSGDPVVLLHGWPGDHGDWREVVTRLDGRADVVVPDLRGFGESDKHLSDPAQAYSASGQAASVASLLGELSLGPAVIAGYDVGSRVAQQIARSNPELVRALVLAPPLPGAGERVLSADAQREFWYQHFHRLGLIEELLDGRPSAVRAYLEHFWSHWSGPAFTPSTAELDRLTALYGAPGAFVASIGWYRAGAP
jgi:pimeloyl-ACP methyl ester carboxylesterase